MYRVMCVLSVILMEVAYIISFINSPALIKLFLIVLIFVIYGNQMYLMLWF